MGDTLVGGPTWAARGCVFCCYWLIVFWMGGAMQESSQSEMRLGGVSPYWWLEGGRMGLKS